MMFKTHEVTGITACTASLPFLIEKGLINESSLLTIGIFFAGGLMGAMLPDIDSPTSKVRRSIRKVTTGNPQTEKRVINHRRLPHMPLFWAAIFILLFKFVYEPHVIAFIWGMAVGVASHLLIDMLNPAGIPLFGPFTRKKTHIMKIYTNSKGETVILILMVLVEIYLIYSFRIQIIDLLPFTI